VLIGFWWGFIRARSYFEETDVGGKTMLKLNFKK
jgi:hypothetical protein